MPSASSARACSFLCATTTTLSPHTLYCRFLFTRRETVQTPSGPREETLIIGCYVDDLFTLYSHDDKHSIYHSFTKQLKVDRKVEDEGPIANLLNIEITQSKDGKVKLHWWKISGNIRAKREYELIAFIIRANNELIRANIRANSLY